MEHDGRDSAFPDFGTLLRSYRIEAGLSQEALAERARVSLHGISALERGYRQWPRRDTLELLARALALTDGQRQVFLAAAARPRLPRRRGETSVTIGPWTKVQGANLPFSLASFVGRVAEVNEIAALARERRLVTITGAGGIGKTQTALRVTNELRDLVENVHFVALAPVEDPSLVAGATATALRIQEVPNRPLIETLVRRLKPKAVLLILDNCEHVIHEAAKIAHALLLACPSLRILATAREPLRLAGESTYQITSLNVTDATALFIDRASAADPHFALTYNNAPTIAKICQRLDGIPLAIELAAARVNALSLETLARKLDIRFATDSVGDRAAPPRQKTMSATIDWSYSLLSQPEQRVFERLSVFAGRFALDAATIVCADDNVAEDCIGDLLSSLVEKSLVIAGLDEPQPRYRFLEPFREYAREALATRGEQNVVRQRHAFACREMIGQFNGSYSFMLANQPDWLPHVELDDWQLALTWTLIRLGDVQLGQELVGSLNKVWYLLPVEGRRWITAANELVTEQTPAQIVARLKYAEADNARALRDWETQLASGKRAAEIFGAIGDAVMANAAMGLVGQALVELERFTESEIVLLDVLEGCSRLGETPSRARALNNLALTKARTGDLGAAKKYVADAVMVYKQQGRTSNIAATIGDLSGFEFDAGDVESALSNAARALAMARLTNDANLIAFSLVMMARCLTWLDRYSESQECALEALAVAREQQLTFWILAALWEICAIAVIRYETTEKQRLRLARVARVLAFAEAGLASRGERQYGLAQQAHDRPFDALRKALGPEELARLMAEGATMTEVQACEAISNL